MSETPSGRSVIRRCCGRPSRGHPRDHCPYSPVSTPASTPAPQGPALHVQNVFAGPATAPAHHHFHAGQPHQGISSASASGMNDIAYQNGSNDEWQIVLTGRRNVLGRWVINTTTIERPRPTNRGRWFEVAFSQLILGAMLGAILAILFLASLSGR